MKPSIYKLTLLSLFALMLSGCMGLKALGLVNKRPFVPIELSTKRYFANDIQATRQLRDAYYRTQAKKLIVQSGYFRGVSAQSPYRVEIEYRQINHTSLGATVASMMNPIQAVFGANFKCSVEMIVSVTEQGREIESYHYDEKFTAKLENIPTQAQELFDTFMEQWLEDMRAKSKVDRVQ